jgi:hypothetical protein
MRTLVFSFLIVFLVISLSFGETIYLSSCQQVEDNTEAEEEKGSTIPNYAEIISSEKERILKAEQDKAMVGEENNLGSMTMAQNGSGSKTGNMLLIAGLATAGVGTFLAIWSQKMVTETASYTEYYWWGSAHVTASITYKKHKDWLWPGVAMIGGGAVLTFLGLRMRKSAQNRAIMLENRSKKEGYLTLGVDPRYDQVHVAYNIDF